MCAARLSYPKQYSGRLFSVGSTPEQIEVWLKENLKFNAQESGHKMRQVLVELNRIEMDTPLRYQIMLRMAEHIEGLLNQLELENVQYSNFVLDKRKIERSELIKQLLRETAYGFNVLVSEMANLPDPMQLRGQISRSIYYGMSFLSRNLMEHYLMYEPTAGGIWGELNLLYRYANQLNLERWPVCDKNSHAHTIEEKFIAILLFSAINPYRLKSVDIYKTYAIIARWSHLCHFEIREPGWQSDGELTVDLASDRPVEHLPSGQRFTDLSMIRVLNTDQILNEREGNSEWSQLGLESNNDAQLMSDLLERLTTGWRSDLQRRSVRRSSYAEMELAIGLKACHTLMARHAPAVEFDPMDGDMSADDAVWYSSYASDFFERDGGNANLNLHTIKQMDVGLGGYGLKCSESEGIEIEVGDLVCVRHAITDSDLWRIGDVRWKRVGEHNLVMFGIRILAGDAKPFFDIRASGYENAEDATPGLLIPGDGFENPAASLLLPANTYNPSDILHILTSERRVNVQLTSLQEHSAKFVQFSYTVLSD